MRALASTFACRFRPSPRRLRYGVLLAVPAVLLLGPALCPGLAARKTRLPQHRSPSDGQSRSPDAAAASAGCRYSPSPGQVVSRQPKHLRAAGRSEQQRRGDRGPACFGPQREFGSSGSRRRRRRPAAGLTSAATAASASARICARPQRLWGQRRLPRLAPGGAGLYGAELLLRRHDR